MMRIMDWLLGRHKVHPDVPKTFEAMSNEIPEQRNRFYLEVAAQLGNESAARALANMGDDKKNRPN